MATYTGSDKRLKYLFDHIGDGGGHKIFYGTCNTSASARQKEVTVSSDQDFYLDTGVVVFVTFNNTNTYEADASNPVTLNVNGSGSNNIKYGSSSTPTGTNTTAFGRANYTNCYVFDGTYWVWQGSSADNNTTYQNRAEAQGGTQTSLVTTGDKYTWNRKVSDNPTFTEASARANIASGESFATILGKIKKYFTDLKAVAFSGSYNDLSNKPTIPTVPDIVDNLTTNDATKVLSAKQGKVLNDNVIDYEKRGYLGKNYLDITLEMIKSANTSGTWSGNVLTLSNATFEVLEDEQKRFIGVKVNGTNSTSSDLNFFVLNRNSGVDYRIPTGSYTMNGCPANGSSSTYRLSFQATRNSSLYNYGDDVGSGVANKSVQDTDRLQIVIKLSANTTVSNKLFTPMIRLATVTDGTYQPYIKSNYELENDVDELVKDKAPISFLTESDESGNTYASEQHAQGSIFYKDGKLKQATQYISVNAQLTSSNSQNTNLQKLLEWEQISTTPILSSTDSYQSVTVKGQEFLVRYGNKNSNGTIINGGCVHLYVGMSDSDLYLPVYDSTGFLGVVMVKNILGASAIRVQNISVTSDVVKFKIYQR